MNKLDFRKHCEKQIERCIKLNDAKHLQEHELALAMLNENERLIQENKKYKEAIDKISRIIYEIDELINTTGGYPSNCIDDLLAVLKEV